MVCLALRDPGEIVGPRRLSGVAGRLLNFTLGRHMQPPPDTIDGDLVKLRRARPADAQALYLAARDPEVMRFMDWPMPSDPRDTELHLGKEAPNISGPSWSATVASVLGASRADLRVTQSTSVTSLPAITGARAWLVKRPPPS